MKVEVLISCMHQTDHSIIDRTNIHSDVIVINQCNIDKREEFTFLNKKGEQCHAIFISTTERGLSKSRNMAIKNATADICLICDDDEILEDNYKETIINTYIDNPKYSFITFNLNDKYRNFPMKSHDIGFIGALKLASWQITFRRKDIINKNLSFDTEMGAGVTMGGSEENKFIIDCLNEKLKGVYIPKIIGSVSQASSTWEVNHENYVKYFIDRGKAYEKLMGRFWGSFYIFYSSIKKAKQYTVFCPIWDSIKLQFKGLHS